MLFLWLGACETSQTDTPQIISLENLSGVVQKGPFMSGTAITIAELNIDLGQTGRNFTTEITDNLGRFQIENIELSSQFVELRADGFYFNEVKGEPSSARLVLTALSDLTDKNTLNVNLLSHLEDKRIIQLISEGLNFSEAKSQAQQEILRIFSFENNDMPESEKLDITGSGDDHAVLLAISVILQGHRTVAELSELISQLGSDLKEDGELNDLSLGSELINHAVNLDLSDIREKLENRYSAGGQEVTLPEFEKYVQFFIENSPYEVTRTFGYPEFSPYGENILFEGKTSVEAHKGYSLAADLPEGAHLAVRLSGGLWYYQVMPEGPVNWSVSRYDSENQTQLFTSENPGAFCDLHIEFSPYISITDSTTMKDSIIGNEILIEVFENLSDSATWIKKIEILE